MSDLNTKGIECEATIRDLKNEIQELREYSRKIEDELVHATSDNIMLKDTIVRMAMKLNGVTG